LSVEEVLRRRGAELRGRVITAEEAAELSEKIGGGPLPEPFLEWLLSFRLTGAEFELSEEEDESGLGVEMRWLTPSQIVSEATEAYPGLAALPAGYLPVGMCLVGSGDPYFIKADSGGDPAVVRIPHQAVGADERLDLDLIEQVSPRLSDFLLKAAIG
jgi:hypothetical protein